MEKTLNDIYDLLSEIRDQLKWLQHVEFKKMQGWADCKPTSRKPSEESDSRG